MNQQETLRTDILRMGFDVVRFARIENTPQTQSLQNWIDQNYHADMHWMSNTATKRMNPVNVLPHAKSVIMLGVNYFPQTEHNPQNPIWAHYSLYSDYHDTIPKGLIQIGHLLETQLQITKHDYKYYVDTGPVMERGWAIKSGIGFQGKNGMLISKQFGNWLFLSCILTTIDFEPDQPIHSNPTTGNLCGKCTKCMDSCPTDAITQPGQINANLCISYHTIENKGSIPIPIREQMGTRLFGCDICLEVCPWNRFAKQASSALLENRSAIQNLDFIELLEMTPEHFSTTFKGTVVKRLKLERLKRNACVVVGNFFLENPSHPQRNQAIHSLQKLSQNESPLIQEHARWALDKITSS